MSPNSLDALRTGIRQAEDALRSLDRSQREQNPGAVARLEKTLAYAAVVAERTDSDILSDEALQGLISALGEIANNPQAVAAVPPPHHQALLRWLAYFPLTQDREVEQSITDVARTFRRSATAHNTQVQREADALRAEIGALKQTLDTQYSETMGAIQARQQELADKLTVIEGSVGAAEQTITQLAATEEQRFAVERDERAGHWEGDRDELIKEFRERTDGTLADLTEKGAGTLAEIERMRDEAQGVVGAVSAATVANHFDDDAKREWKSYWALMSVAGVLALIAVGVAVWIASTSHDDLQTLFTKLAISTVLLAVGGVLANRSRDHREREKVSRQKAMDLRAFGPFIEVLPADTKEKVREEMVARFFAQEPAAPNAGQSGAQDGVALLADALRSQQ